MAPLRIRRTRNPGLGFDWTQALAIGGDAAGSLFGDPTLGNQAVAGLKFVEGIGGLVGMGAGSVADQARAARCNSYYIGAAAGIVDSARLLLGRTTEGIPSKELAMYQNAISRIQGARPDVWQAAQEAGPLHDVNYPPSSMAGDGQKGLALLLQYKIGINLPYMGTDDGQVVNQQTQQIVAQLKQLAASPAPGTTAGHGVIPQGAVVTGQGIQGILTNLQKPSVAGLPLWIVIGIGGAAMWYILRGRR